MPFASAEFGVTCWFSQAVLFRFNGTSLMKETKWVTFVSAVLTDRILPEWAEPASGGQEQGGGNF